MVVQGRELGVAVIREVTAHAVHFKFAHVWRVNRVVAAAHEFIAQELLENATDHGALGHPKNKPGASKRTDSEQVELFTQDPVVAFFRFLDLAQISVKILL